MTVIDYFLKRYVYGGVSYTTVSRGLLTAQAGNFTTIINWLLDRRSLSWSLLLVELFYISLVLS